MTPEVSRTRDLVLPTGTLTPTAPRFMGVLNATTDSFSDGGRYLTFQSRMDRAVSLVGEGVDILDIGGQSAITGVGELPPSDEIDAVVPLIRAIIEIFPSLIVSVDTYKPSVARASIDAGATIINDTSGLRDPQIADIAALYGAGLVITHNRSRPKERLTDPDLYDDVVEDVCTFLSERAAFAIARGVNPSSIIFDPGPDFSKTPYQTVQVLRRLDAIDRLGRPVLVAVSRKDFVGAITSQAPRDRLGGTLGAIAAIAGAGLLEGRIFRVHDVRQVKDFLAVFDVVRGHREISPTLQLHADLRRERRTTDTEV